MEYWEYVDRIFDWPNGKAANLILDDGGDATMYILLGASAEAGESILAAQIQRKKSFEGTNNESPGKSPGWFNAT